MQIWVCLFMKTDPDTSDSDQLVTGGQHELTK